jgi:ferritin-like metal-binding protein YciE
MKMNTLKEVYLAELQELHHVEEQLTQALPQMRDRAQHEELKQVFDQHLEETRSQRERVETILRNHGADPQAHQDQAMERLLAEAEKTLALIDEPAVRDAEMIASAQKVEHYEIAAYGTVATYAGILGFTDDQNTLHAILDEEKNTDRTLTDLADTVVNKDAARAA